jgi:DNA polymerase-3 subunit delta'
MGDVSRDETERLADALQAHQHARAMLRGALSPGARPSHAYLFHGPAGVGKRTAARIFAAELLADGGDDPHAVRERVLRGSHPDLTWVTPSGASEVLVSDIDEPVVAAATRTPFEASRRVFVIEAAGTMNDQAANRLLKTLEEPPSFAHLILLAEHLQDVLPTIASRCQQVRFDALSSAHLERLLTGPGADPIEPQRASACARLSGGDAALARRLAGERGGTLRDSAQAFVRAALGGHSDERRWSELLAQAKDAGTDAGEQAGERLRLTGELLPGKERRKHEREGADVVRRAERRARAGTLDLALRLAELWLRDVWCIAGGAPELVYAVDRRAELYGDAEGRPPDALARAVELVRDTRLRLPLNVSEELALEALSYRLGDLLG